LTGWPWRRNKYGNRKTEVDGITFDSKKEAQRYAELCMLEKAGLIQDLQRQVRFEIVPKCGASRARHYIADFTYQQEGRKVIEDVKSPATRADKVYSLKRALMIWKYTEAGGLGGDWIFREM
jgi:hypothetical protein